jgi:hypothetical protein
MRDKLVSVRVEIPQELKARFKSKCALSGIDMRTALMQMIVAYVESGKDLDELFHVNSDKDLDGI